MKKFSAMFKDFTLFLSAFVPMFVLIFLRLGIDMLNNNLSFNVLNTLNFVTLILLIAVGIGGLIWNIRGNGESIEIEICTRKNITDEHFLGYFSLFVLFALQLNLSLVSGYCLFVTIMVFIGIVYIKNSLYFINPLLNLLGYSFYEVIYKVEGKEDERHAKIFHKGDLKVSAKYYVNLKNDNFTFIDKKGH